MGPYMALGGLFGNQAVRCLEHRIIAGFDRRTANELGDCDIFHFLSGTGVRALQVARDQFGALTVCDRASSHILYQSRLLREEFHKWGMPYVDTDRRIIDRELREYESADLIVVPSEFARRSFIEEGISGSKVAKNPFGVNLRTFHRNRSANTTFRAIFVGQISLRKGIPYLLEALLNLELPNFELWLVGAILPEAKPFLAKHEGRFRYFGSVPQAQLYQYYSEASVFVIASIEEGLAYVQGEAMACGLPIVATANTGAEDLFTDGVEGFIVPIRDVEAIRDRVLRLYHDEGLRHEMSEAAVRRVQSMGGWNEYGDRMAKIYSDRLRRAGVLDENSLM